MTVATETRPRALPVNVEGVPLALRTERRWVIWRHELRKGKWTKVPYVATAPQREASSTDPATWSSYQQALEAYRLGMGDGIGFVLGDGFFGFDADDCRNPQSGEVHPAVMEHYRRLATYTEVSPSGEGLKAIGRGTKPGTKCRVKGPAGTGIEYELYDKARYFAVTGHVLPDLSQVEDRSTELAALYAALFGRNEDDDLIARAQAAANCEKFRKLWAGDTSGYTSHSEADAALCAILAYWTDNDARRIDRLFRRSGLMREKWDDRRGQSTYGDQTIDFALHHPDRPAEIVVVDDPPPAAPVAPYYFVPAFAPEHFVSRWVAHYGRQCDAASEYHEAAALVALAQATPTVKARISGSAEGLRTNLYVLFVGDPGRTRKSTAKNYAVETVKRALPGVLLPEQMTQESLVESLSDRSGGAALWAVDEFTDTLTKMVNSTYLAGMRGLLLEMYAQTDYTYRRVSKRPKKKDDGDGEREEDAFHVTNVTFSMIGCATPTLFQNIDNTAVGSGLLTRFAVVMPESKPPRIPQYELQDEDAISSALVQWLRGIADRTRDKRVSFAPGVLQMLDSEIDAPLDESSDRCQMTVRAGVMVRKVAMLAAAGRPAEYELADQPLVVNTEDAEAAIRVVRRWIDYAQAFDARTNETRFEIQLEKCVRIARGHTVNRRDVAKVVHVTKKEMDDIQATLVDRGHIEVVESRKSTGRAGIFWRWVR